MLLPLALLALAQQPSTTPAAPRHPLITEVLYAVAPGAAGDANKDGTRDVNGDEFIELVNPHDTPIQLAGYVLADRELSKGEKKFTSMRFKFPAVELKPGQVLVVFNGHEQKWTGPVGTAAAAPSGGNELFGSALVFTMEITSAKQGLANKGDCVQLIAPDGAVVSCITRGDGTAPAGAAKVEQAPLVTRGSIERVSKDGPLLAADSMTPGVWKANEKPAGERPKPEGGAK